MAHKKLRHSEGESPVRRIGLSSELPSVALSLPGGMRNIPPKVDPSEDMSVRCT